MYFKCELLIGGMVHNVTDNLVNWNDVEMSFQRNDYDGVIRSFSTKFRFANGAYSLLLDEYLANYLHASASLVFYLRNNSWLWDEKFRCALDFSTLTYDGTTCEINAVDDSLASLIKAKKGTQYEYAVSGMKESQPLYYDRLEMTSNIEWIMAGSHEEIDGKSYYSNTFDFGAVNVGSKYFTVPIYLKTSEIAVKNIIEVQDVSMENIGSQVITSHYFFKNISDHSIRINIKGKFTLKLSVFNEIGYDECRIRLAYIYGGNSGKSYIPIFNSATSVGGYGEYATLTTAGDNVIGINSSDFPIYGNGCYLALVVDGKGKVKISQEEALSSEETLSITFNDRDKPVSIDVVKPVTLLNRLLKSMNSGREGITGEIIAPTSNPDLGGLNYALLIAAESVRGLEKAKIYSSYSKFAQWMSSEFGFVPVIGDNKVTFVHRDALFQDKEVKNLGDKVVDFEYTVNPSMIYSRLRVGYDKQDYDSVNGRDEFHFTNEYTTGVTLTDNTLELISPYRADAYGIEFLAAKRGEDTTDSDSDNDLFFVGAELVGSQYKLIRRAISGVISPETMFNAMYAQRYMIEANSKFIGAFTRELNFASSDGNSDVVLDGVSEKEDIAIPLNDFTVGEISFSTGDTGIPSDLSGYISVSKNGRRYKGYVKKAGYNHGRAEPVKYELIVKSVE